MNVLIVDTETTGFSPKQHQMIELGAILYSVEHRCILQQMSTLLPCEENPVEWVNRIPAAATQVLHQIEKEQFGGSGTVSFLQEHCIDWFNDAANEGHAKFAIAHNYEFDKSFIEAHENIDVSIQWLDSNDIEFPRKHKKSMNLAELCLAHDVPVLSAHRALTDCQLIARLFDITPNLEELLVRAARPKLVFVAQVSYDDRDKAKAAGFVWNTIVPKQWAKKMPVEDTVDLPFDVVQSFDL